MRLGHTISSERELTTWNDVVIAKFVKSKHSVARLSVLFSPLPCVKYRHMKKSNSRSKRTAPILMCGAAAGLIGQGCADNMRSLTDVEWDQYTQTMTDGEESIAPVVESISEIADESNLFGFGGEGGQEEFLWSVEQAQGRLDEMIEHGNIFAFDDPNYKGGAFFFDFDLTKGSRANKADRMAFNLAFFRFLYPDEPNNHMSKERVGYSTSLHESAHEWERHSKAINKSVNNGAEERLTTREKVELYVMQERDFPYLVSFMVKDIEQDREDCYIDGYEMQRLWSRLENDKLIISNFEDSGLIDQAEYIRSQWRDLIPIISTPEGYINYAYSNAGYSFAQDYLGIPEEELLRVYAESGWYEDFVEGEMNDLINEAKLELNIEFTEGELRDIDLSNLQEWRAEIQERKAQWEKQVRESEMQLDGYEQERRQSMGARR